MLSGHNGLKILAAVSVFHLVKLLAWRITVPAMGFNPEQRKATLFCAAEKTLQIPAYLAISVLGAPAAAVTPVVHHVVELVADSLIVSYYNSSKKSPAGPPPAAGDN